MRLNCVALGVSTSDEVTRLRMLPAFRKATRSMTMAFASIESALSQNGLTEKIKARPEDFSLVVSSSFGELETTKDFLKTFAETRMARPLLFQNSLHNSTSGFLAIQFGLTGKVVTISHGLYAGEHALEAAALIQSQNEGLSIVTTVESVIPELMNTPSIGEILENATTLIFATESICQRYNLSSLGVITDVKCTRTLKAEKQSYSALAGSSDALLTCANAFRSAPGTIIIKKPGASFSEITWSKS